MIRLAGHNLPDEKRIDYALTLIHGIGWKRSALILSKAGVKAETRVKDLTDALVHKLQENVAVFKVEGDLKEEVNMNIKRLRETGAYRGVRHTRGLPVHGQRTKSNARTNKGKKKTVGAFKKEDIARMQQQSQKK